MLHQFTLRRLSLYVTSPFLAVSSGRGLAFRVMCSARHASSLCEDSRVPVALACPPIAPLRLLRRAEELFQEAVLSIPPAGQPRLFREEEEQLRGQLVARLGRTVGAIDGLLAVMGACRCSECVRGALLVPRVVETILGPHTEWLCALRSFVDPSMGEDGGPSAAFAALLYRIATSSPSAQEMVEVMAAVGRAFPSAAPLAGPGVLSCRRQGAAAQHALYALCRERCVWRLLVDNHLALLIAIDEARGPQPTASVLSTPSAIVSLVPLQRVVEDAIRCTRRQCEDSFGAAPRFVVSAGRQECGPFGLYHAEHAVAYIVRELIKNAACAAMQRRRGGRPMEASVTVELAACLHGACDVPAVRLAVHDSGPGLPTAPCIWDFGWSAASSAFAAGVVPISGNGVGLPLSRILAEQFGGSLTLSGRQSGEGRTDGCTAVFIHPLDGIERPRTSF